MFVLPYFSVCKKWMTISLKSWSSVKNVHVAQDFDHIKHPNSTHLKEILRRGGDYITYLRFNSYTNNLTGDEVIDAISKCFFFVKHFGLFIRKN